MKLKTYLKNKKGTSSQDGGIGRYTVPPHITKRRTTTNLKTKKQPELTENLTVWKLDNQGVKEETFIQTNRRGKDRQWVERTPGKAAAGGPAKQQIADWVVPHSCTDKLGGTTGE